MRVDARHLRIRFGPWRGAGVRQPTIKARSLRAGIRYPGAACKRRADSGVNHGVVHGQTLRLGRVIHRRLRGAPGGSPRRLLNNSGPTIRRAGCPDAVSGHPAETRTSYNANGGKSHTTGTSRRTIRITGLAGLLAQPETDISYNFFRRPVWSLNSLMSLSQAGICANILSQNSGAQRASSSSTVLPCCSTQVKYFRLCSAFRSQ